MYRKLLAIVVLTLSTLTGYHELPVNEYLDEYIVVTNASMALEPQEIRRGEEFLGFVFEGFSSGIWPFDYGAHFSGDMVLRGNFYTTTDTPTHLAGIISYDLELSIAYADYFPRFLRDWMPHWQWISLRIANVAEFQEMLELSNEQLNDIYRLEILGMSSADMVIRISGLTIYDGWFYEIEVTEIIYMHNELGIMTAARWAEIVLEGNPN